MSKAVRLGALVLVTAVALVWLAQRARESAPGPSPDTAGDQLAAAAPAESAVDWAFAAPIREIALQTANPPRSRRVWLVVHDGTLYVPSGLAPGPAWPHDLVRDPTVLLRVSDRQYVRSATRVRDTELLDILWAQIARKYDVTEPKNTALPWIFRMDPYVPNG